VLIFSFLPRRSTVSGARAPFDRWLDICGEVQAARCT
jgi:hypothetical protein